MLAKLRMQTQNCIPSNTMIANLNELETSAGVKRADSSHADKNNSNH